MNFTIISNESILRRIPKFIDPRQKKILEGIIFGIDMFCISYTSLYSVLLQLSFDQESDNDSRFYSFVLCYISQILTVISRLRGLIPILIDDCKQEQVISQFMTSTESIRRVRNEFEHLNSKVDKLVKDNESVWGHLTWIYMYQEEFETNGTFYLHVLIPGFINDGNKQLFQNLPGLELKCPLGQITYYFLENKVIIDELFDLLSEYAVWLEKQLDSNIKIILEENKNKYSDIELSDALEPSARGFSGRFKMNCNPDIWQKQKL